MAKAKTCGRPDCACDRKTRGSGSVTWIAVVFAVAIVGAALWFTMREGRTATKAAAFGASWLPEPSYLLDHAAQLKLSDEQKRHVLTVVREWDMKKAGFDAQFHSLNTDTKTVLADLQSGKNLSGPLAKPATDFNKARLKAWTSATSTLTADQAIDLDNLRNPSSRTSASSANSSLVAMLQTRKDTTTIPQYPWVQDYKHRLENKGYTDTKNFGLMLIPVWTFDNKSIPIPEAPLKVPDGFDAARKLRAPFTLIQDHAIAQQKLGGQQ